MIPITAKSLFRVNSLGSTGKRAASFQAPAASTYDQASKLLIIPSANGTISKKIVVAALRDNMDVIALTGDLQKAQKIYGHSPQLNLVPVKHADYADRKAIEQIVKSAIGNKTYDILGVANTLGGVTSAPGIPDSEGALIRKNILIPRSFISGVLRAGKDHAGVMNVAHLSSIAATISDTEQCYYARVRKEGETILSEVAEDHGAKMTTHLRVGVVLNRPDYNTEREKWVIDNGHNHSPENWSGKRLIAVVGSGEQIQQPVCSDNVAEGVIAASKRDFGPDHWVVNGVSRDMFSQKDLITYFSPEKKIVCVHVPYEVARILALIASDGRFQPYAINILESLEKAPDTTWIDPSDFETLIGKTSLSIGEVYPKHVMTKIEHKGLEISRYVYHFLKSSFQNPEQAAAFFKAAISSADWKISTISPK